MRPFVKWLIFVSIIAQATLAESAPSAAKEAYSWKGKLVIPEPHTVYASSSEYLREHRTFYAHLGLGLISGELAIGYYLNPDALLDLRVGRQIDIVAGSSDMYALSYSQFVMNSLFLRGGGAFRVGQTIDYIGTVTGHRTSAYSSEFGLDLGLGNRWQWDHISLGCEWIAAYVPLFGSDLTGVSVQLRALLTHIGVSW